MYDGKTFHGWQIQENAVTVQEEFQKALRQVIGEECDIKGCSRTDAGVHANMYCVSFRTEHPIPVDRIPPALNHFLPTTIAVKRAMVMDEGFHARYSCRGKEYVYKIWNHPVRNPFVEGYALHYWYPLDLSRMNEAAAHLLGTHDFTSFCTPDTRKKDNMCRTIRHAEWTRQGDMVQFTIEADGFLYNMVRIIVGTLLYVAQGKIAPEDIPKITAAKDRHFSGPTAPPQGLYLNRVFYDGIET